MSTTDQTNQSPAPENKPADKPAEKRKTITLTRLSLTAPCPTAPGMESIMYWGVFDGTYPRLIVKTNDPADEQNTFGKITAAMDVWAVGSLSVLINQAITEPNGWKMALPMKNKYHDGKRFDTAQLINNVVVGKSAEGVIYLSVHEQGRPEIKFPLVHNEYVQMMHADGTLLTNAESSPIFAKGYANLINEIIGNIVAATAIDRSNNPEEYVRPANSSGFQKKPWQGGQGNNNNQGGGGGGYNRNNNYNNGGGQGGYQKKPWQGGQGGQGGGNRNGWQGGGGGGYNRNNGGGGGNYNNRQQNSAPVDMSDGDIPL